MTPPLFLVDRLSTAADFVLNGDEGRHGARVLRLRAGEVVLVSDGLGGVLDCEVLGVEGDTLRLHARGARTEPVPRPRLVVVQALPKGERAELAVEILTELGVDEIVPWAASRSVVRWDGPRGAKSLEKWRRTARTAAKQCRRARVPVVTDLASTDELLTRCAGSLILHEDATTALAAVALPDPDDPGADDIVLVVGPEGGIATDELARFTAAGGIEVRLGEPVLRTSTAGAAALAVLSARLGRWS